MKYTENYNLPQYEGTDPINLTDGYNEAMGIVDVALKTDADNIVSEVERLEGDLATTNANLNATNQNAAALKKQVEDNFNQQIATDAQQQTEIDALRNANSPSGADFQALTAKVTNNTTLVDEHVNYFADLGVTDEQSAHDLHSQIDQSFQGVMSNTQAISELQLTTSAVRLDNNIADVFTKYGVELADVTTQFDLRVGATGTSSSLRGEMTPSFISGSIIVAPKTNDQSKLLLYVSGVLRLSGTVELPFSVSTAGTIVYIEAVPQKSAYQINGIRSIKLGRKVGSTVSPVTYTTKATSSTCGQLLFNTANEYANIQHVDFDSELIIEVNNPTPPEPEQSRD